MKKTIKSICTGTLLSASFLTGCKNINKVTLTFVQHTFVNYSYDDSNEINGYYFKNDKLAETTVTFSKGHNLTQGEIDSYYSNSIKYEVPELNGDGYWSFTFFTTDLDEETGLSKEYLEPCKLNKNLTIHFGIY